MQISWVQFHSCQIENMTLIFQLHFLLIEHLDRLLVAQFLTSRNDVIQQSLFLSSHLSCFLACKISSVSLHLLRKYPASGFFEGLMSPITLWLELQQHCWSQLSVSLGWTYDFRKLFIERRICYFLSMLTCMWRCSWTVEFRVLTVIVAIMKHVKLAFWK